MRVAVVGGNVAGSYLAHLLARNRVEVDLFDPRVPWAKPCGGGITRKAMGEFHLLETVETEAVVDYQLTAPSGVCATFTTNEPLYLLPRVKLSDHLLQTALESGSRLFKEKIRQVERVPGGRWRLRSDRRDHGEYDLLVGADGAVSTVRRLVDRPFDREDLILALDYHFEAPRLPPHVGLEFLGSGMGYLWLFAAEEYASAGIGVPAVRVRNDSLKITLDRFLSDRYRSLDLRRPHESRWVIPYHRRGFESRYRVQGEGWAMVGDAAGLVDPMTGEGIYYALKSSRLLAEAILFERPDRYGPAVEREIRPELSKAYGIAKDYFSVRLLNLVVRGARRSPSLCDFLEGYLTGQASYLVAQRNLLRRARSILGEVVGWRGRKRRRKVFP